MTSIAHVYQAEHRYFRLKLSERETASSLTSGTSTLSAFSATAYTTAMILPETNKDKTLALTIVNLSRPVASELLVHHTYQTCCSFWVVFCPTIPAYGLFGQQGRTCSCLEVRNPCFFFSSKGDAWKTLSAIRTPVDRVSTSMGLYR